MTTGWHNHHGQETPKNAGVICEHPLNNNHIYIDCDNNEQSEDCDYGIIIYDRMALEYNGSHKA